MQTWIDVLAATIDSWDGRWIVVSPDIDGILSAALFKKHYNAMIAGIYSTVDLVLVNGATREDAQQALWLDHDITAKGIRCIGQHLLRVRDDDSLTNVCLNRFNPNEHFNQTYARSFKGVGGLARDKYPFGTIHFLMEGLREPYPSMDSEGYALFAHADGTWANAIKYRPNCNRWRDLMFASGGLIDDVTTESKPGGYTTRRSALASHRRLVENLKRCGVCASGSAASSRSSILPVPWRGLQGVQSLGFPKSGQRDMRERKIRDILPRLDQLTRYVAGCLGWGGHSAPTIVSEIYFGELHRVPPYPYLASPGTLDGFLSKMGSFSHAVIDYRTMQFTTGIDIASG